MIGSLRNARVALLEARRESELASLVRRHGGNPVCAPALRETERECVDDAVRALGALDRDGTVVVLATGVGLDRWLAVVTSNGRADDLRRGLSRATVVCRGPKPIAVLKREGLVAHVRAVPPHTTTELLAALDPIDVRDHNVVYVHDGGAIRTVPESLARRGAHVFELQPYGWALPDDVEPLRELVRGMIAGDIDAVAFTTQIQARHLFEVAESIGLQGALSDAMRGRVIVAAVGPTCAAALAELGVPPHVVPEQSKMGPLVIALAAHIEAARPAEV